VEPKAYHAQVRPAGATAAIAGIGCYLPAETITNADLAEMVDTNEEWIVSRTGIRSRHRATAGDATSDLSTRAARLALADAGVEADELDFVIVATATPDSPVPATACVVQESLGATRAAAMDLNAGCTGFLYALHTAEALVRAGSATNVLVIGADTLTRVTDYTDRRTCVLFGDGAGACVVSATGSMRVIYSSVGADGTEKGLITIPAGGSRQPASAETIGERGHYLHLDGTRVFRQAVRHMVEAAQEGLRCTGLTADQIACVIPHQANARIITAVGEQLGVDPLRVVLDMAETGNTSAASLPIALTHVRESRGFAAGELVMLLAFGAGLTWACQILRVEV
jgi:3-oxoacyl-[acyl-carrier-protein] synthase-3